MNRELPDVQAGFRKGRGTRDQMANIHWIIKKARALEITVVDVSVAETTVNKCEKPQKSKSLISSDCLTRIFQFLRLKKGTRASMVAQG